METIKVRNLNELYQDGSLYSSPEMFSPPSERLSHVIRFELTKGCSWARCTYCGGYDGIKHVVKSIDEYKEHVEEVWDRIGEKSSLAKSLRRVFIGGGNALEVETEMLNEAIQYTGRRFVENTGQYPKRISLYGRTKDILQKGKKGLSGLRSGRMKRLEKFFHPDLPYGLNLIYWGVEIGSTEVLDYVNKGCTKEEILKASKIVNGVFVGIDTSVMIMPGLGGEKFYDVHVKDSAKVLGEIRPKFITFMGVNPASNSRYFKNIIREEEKGRNRPLTYRELTTQMIEIIERMPVFKTKIGCFPSHIDKVGFNPLNFGPFNISYSGDKESLVKGLKVLAK